MRLAHHQTPAADMPHRAPEPLAPPTTVQSAPRLLRRADLLRDFLAVVNAGGIRAAAEQVHLSQSALTRRVQELERLLDVQLFERHALGMRLTRFGEVLRHHAQLVDLNCYYAATELEDLRDGGAGELRLAAGPAWDAALVPDAIAAVQKTFPRIRFFVTSRHNDSTLPMLSDARLDLVLGSIPQPHDRDPNITYEHVMHIEHRVFAHARHPLHTRRQKLRPQDLQHAAPWLWFSEAVTTRADLRQWFRQDGLEAPDSAIEVTSLQAAVRLMQQGDYLMLLPSTLIPVLVERQLRPLETRGSIARYSVGMMYRQSTLRMRAFAELRKHLLLLAGAISG